MTINCTEIETLLAPVRKLEGLDNGVISLRGAGRAGASLQWSDTMEPPVSDWLGDAAHARSHAEVLQRMRVATFIAFMDRIPVLSQEHPWCLLDHQAAGHACTHIRFVGRRIFVRPDIESQFLEIATSWYNQQLGWNLPCLSDLMKYRGQLQSIDLDCNGSGTFRYLMESLYPVDLTQAVLDRVCLQPFPLEGLLGSPRALGNVEHYAILMFIAPNSD
jgi:hypothetical protein